MSKSFKINPDTFEDTQKVIRYGHNVRKLQAKKKLLERREKRKQQERYVRGGL